MSSSSLSRRKSPRSSTHCGSSTRRRKASTVQGSGDLAQSVLGIVSPIDVDTENPERILSNITPQVLKPALEVYANKDFYTGSKIVRSKMEGIPAAEQYDQGTSEIAKAAGRTLGFLR